jgi:type III secretion protein T
MQASDVSEASNWLLASGIAIARPTGLLALHAAFIRAQITGVARGSVAMGLAFPMIPVLHRKVLETDPGLSTLMLLTFKEAVIGSALGLLLGAPLWALDVAGDVMDAQRGATQGRLNDPGGFEDVSITGTLLIMTGIVVFVVSGGLETLTDLLYDSWEIWPPLESAPSLDTRAPLLLLSLLDRLTQQGLLMALPAVVIMLLTDTALMLTARIAPSLRIEDLALSARNIAFFIFMPLYALFLPAYIRRDMATLPHLFELLNVGAGSEHPQR